MTDCEDEKRDRANTNEFFEGPEKTLEIWFEAVEGKSLRDVPQETWVPMLNMVNCLILSSTKNDHITAYLLSESSFFVFDNMLLLKTCGTTTLLHALDMCMDIAKDAGLTVPINVYYCRQNFFFPSHQLYPHKSFKNETAIVGEKFGEGGGKPLMLGTMNGNHYKFYNWECDPPRQEEELTFEILMTGLDSAKMREYFYKNEKNSSEVGKRCGIADLLKGLADDKDFAEQKIDEFIFDPYGYSMNAVLGKYYFTFHVTPQDVCSYASFETNLPLSNYTELTQRVLKIFGSSEFFVVIVANDAMNTKTQHHNWLLPNGLDGYDRNERCKYEFKTFAIEFSSYCAPNAPRRVYSNPNMQGMLSGEPVTAPAAAITVPPSSLKAVSPPQKKEAKEESTCAAS